MKIKMIRILRKTIPHQNKDNYNRLMLFIRTQKLVEIHVVVVRCRGVGKVYFAELHAYVLRASKANVVVGRTFLK